MKLALSGTETDADLADTITTAETEGLSDDTYLTPFVKNLYHIFKSRFFFLCLKQSGATNTPFDYQRFCSGILP